MILAISMRYVLAMLLIFCSLFLGFRSLIIFSERSSAELRWRSSLTAERANLPAWYLKEIELEGKKQTAVRRLAAVLNAAGSTLCALMTRVLFRARVNQMSSGKKAHAEGFGTLLRILEKRSLAKHERPTLCELSWLANRKARCAVARDGLRGKVAAVATPENFDADSSDLDSAPDSVSN